jgi:hypothetical protein
MFFFSWPTSILTLIFLPQRIVIGGRPVPQMMDRCTIVEPAHAFVEDNKWVAHLFESKFCRYIVMASIHWWHVYIFCTTNNFLYTVSKKTADAHAVHFAALTVAFMAGKQGTECTLRITVIFRCSYLVFIHLMTMGLLLFISVPVHENVYCKIFQELCRGTTIWFCFFIWENCLISIGEIGQTKKNRRNTLGKYCWTVCHGTFCVVTLCAMSHNLWTFILSGRIKTEIKKWQNADYVFCTIIANDTFNFAACYISAFSCK